MLVAVHLGAVEMAVADLGGADHGLGDVLGGEAVRPEGPEPHGRHLLAGPERSLGNLAGVDSVIGDAERSGLYLAHA